MTYLFQLQFRILITDQQGWNTFLDPVLLQEGISSKLKMLPDKEGFNAISQQGFIKKFPLILVPIMISHTLLFN